MGRKSNFLVLALLVPAIWFLGTSYEAATDESALAALDTGDTAWMVVASAFVLLMTPGLAFFYGGMVDKKHIISTMLQSFVALGSSACFGSSWGSACALGTASVALLAILGRSWHFAGWG